MDSITKSDIDKHFGKVLRSYRKKAKITQEDLAEQLGISLKYSDLNTKLVFGQALSSMSIIKLSESFT